MVHQTCLLLVYTGSAPVQNIHYTIFFNEFLFCKMRIIIVEEPEPFNHTIINAACTQYVARSLQNLYVCVRY